MANEWCDCGSLEGLIDAAGNRTSWERDLQGRVAREVRADGVTDTIYTYGSRMGRLLTVTDSKDQVTTYTYAADNQQLSTTFTNAVISTPSVSFTYDPVSRVSPQWSTATAPRYMSMSQRDSQVQGSSGA